MNTSLNQGSAKIYQFPAGGRSALGGRRYENANAVTDLPQPRATEVAVGVHSSQARECWDTNQVREP